MVILISAVVHKVQNLFVAAALTFVLGLVIGPIMTAANTVVHQVSDESMRGKVFSSLEIVMHLGFLIAMLISSLLTEYVAHFWILIGVGVVFSIVGLVGLWRYRRMAF